MARGIRLCAQLLAEGREIGDEDLAQACGLRLETVRRLRADDEFTAEVNRLATRLFAAQLPKVLASLTEAGSDGKNASAMKLFIDVWRLFAPQPAADAPKPEPEDVAEILEKAQAAGVDVESLRQLLQ